MVEVKYKVAKYIRLSDEDRDKKESESVENQRDLIDNFIKKHEDLEDAGEYVDDGYTGGNYDRLKFKKMINDIESGKINCIITKDLSRFGRDHIDTGYYLERYLPKKNVRYISIGDGIDTKDSRGLQFLTFKLSFNDYYIQDISKKIKSVKKRKMIKGITMFNILNIVFLSIGVFLPLSSIFNLFSPHIADIFYRLEIILATVLFKNLAEIGHVNFYNGYYGIAVEAPYSVEKLLFGNDNIAVADKIFDYIVHLTGKLDVYAVDLEHLVGKIKLNVVISVFGMKIIVVSSQYGFCSGYKLVSVERLGKIIVRTELKSFDFLIRAAERGKNDYGAGTLFSEFLQYFKTVFLRKKQIENNEVVSV